MTRNKLFSMINKAISRAVTSPSKRAYLTNRIEGLILNYLDDENTDKEHKESKG